MTIPERSRYAAHWTLVAAIALVASACTHDQYATPTVVAFTNTTVIDVTGGPTQSGMTILIAGGRITELGKSESTAIPTNSRVFDASDKFVIPGLWDMHVHTLSTWTVDDRAVDLHEAFFPLFVANGITGVRDMNGGTDSLRALCADGTLEEVALRDVTLSPRR